MRLRRESGGDHHSSDDYHGGRSGDDVSVSSEGNGKMIRNGHNGHGGGSGGSSAGRLLLMAATAATPAATIWCARRRTATWLTGFTFGPLLGIFFQQRQFSKWKVT